MSADILVIPDIHAGYSYSRVAELGEFLKHKLDGEIRHLIFLGDVLELWRNSADGAMESAMPLFAPVKSFVQRGGQVSYIIGNHDYPLLVNTELRKRMNGEMGGVAFYHRYQMLDLDDKKILVAHGDDYDFLYPALVWIDPLADLLMPVALTADDVYRFYQWCCDHYQDIQILEKDGLRAAFLAWLEEYAKQLRDSLPAAATADSTEISNEQREDAARAVSPDAVRLAITVSQPGADAAASVSPSTASSLLLHLLGRLFSRLVSVSLKDIVERTPIAQRWSEIENFAPLSSTLPISDFRAYDHIIVGHFHMPRQSSEYPVTDAGSWVNDPHGKLESATYAIVQADQVQLRQWKNGRAILLSARGL